MDPPGQAMPDSLIAARIANNMERVLREQGKGQYADQFKGFDWKTEEDAFMDGYHGHEKGGEFVTYERLRAMGTNGFQEPATAFTDGKIIGTKRLFADGKFSSKDGKATFMETQWRGLQAPGKEEERKKWPFLINNGRTNIIWQNAYLDQDNEFVMDRMPYPYIQMNPDDMAELKLKQGDLVEVYNDNGSTQAMVYPTPTAKRKQTFMLFAYPDRRSRQRRVGRRERVHHSELQADLGQYPQDRRCAGRREASQLQVDRIHGLTKALSSLELLPGRRAARAICETPQHICHQYQAGRVRRRRLLRRLPSRNGRYEGWEEYRAPLPTAGTVLRPSASPRSAG